MEKIDFEARIESDVENPEEIEVGDYVCVGQVPPVKEVTKIKDGKASLKWKEGKTTKRETVSLKLLSRHCLPDEPMKITMA